ncbi:hypothetical protein TNCV_2913551 [Trichonephila clavipes]|nr:hypothetical protein TNCV_2913551 [Trichonephila clavipes]
MPHHRIQAHCEQLSEFERGRTIELQEAVPWPYFSEDEARPHMACVAMNCLTAYQTLPWLARSLSNRACLGYDGKATASLPGNVDDLARQLEKNSAQNKAGDHQGALSLCHIARHFASWLDVGQHLIELVTL